MKKVLLLAAVALGLSTMGQDAMNSRLLQTEITPTSAAKEKVEDILINRGGALDANYDYTDFLYQFYSSDMVLGAITTTPRCAKIYMYGTTLRILALDAELATSMHRLSKRCILGSSNGKYF